MIQCDLADIGLEDDDNMSIATEYSSYFHVSDSNDDLHALFLGHQDHNSDMSLATASFIEQDHEIPLPHRHKRLRISITSQQQDIPHQLHQPAVPDTGAPPAMFRHKRRRITASATPDWA